MGKRGPTRKPLKMLRDRGSWLADRRTGEPVPPKGKITPPKELDKKARTVWNRVVPMVRKMGILGQCDGETISRYCVAVVMYWETRQSIVKDGMMTVIGSYDKEGNLLSEREEDRPQVRRLKSLSDECRMLENLLGLNPGARASLSIQVPSSPDENRGKSRVKAFPSAAS